MKKQLKILATLSLAGLTPQDIHQRILQHQRAAKAAQTEHVLALALSDEAWCEVAGTPALYRMIDPVTKQEDLAAGKLGTFLGLPLLTDAYLPKRFLPQGISICHYTP